MWRTFGLGPVGSPTSEGGPSSFFANLRCTGLFCCSQAIRWITCKSYTSHNRLKKLRPLIALTKKEHFFKVSFWRTFRANEILGSVLIFFPSSYDNDSSPAFYALPNDLLAHSKIFTSKSTVFAQLRTRTITNMPTWTRSYYPTF